MVAGPAQEDGDGEPEDAQLGDIQTAGGGVEEAGGAGEAAVHRRSEEVAQRAHAGEGRRGRMRRWMAN